MDNTAVEAIRDLAVNAAGKVVTVGDRTYSTTPLHDPRKAEPEPNPLTFHTLQSFVDHALSAHDAAYQEGRQTFIHVASHQAVGLLTGIHGEFNQRVIIAQAYYEQLTGFTPAQWTDPEWFNIVLQTHFEPTADRDKVLELIGNLKSEEVQTVEDDGVTQRVEVRAGVVRRNQQEAPREVVLKPYRTFRELEQVESTYVLRLRGGKANPPSLPEVALFEADGGAWKLEAIERIRDKVLELLGPEASRVSVFA